MLVLYMFFKLKMESAAQTFISNAIEGKYRGMTYLAEGSFENTALTHAMTG